MIRSLITLFFCFSLLHSQTNGDVLRTVILDRINQFITYEESSDEFLIYIYKNEALYETALHTYKDRKYKNRNIKVALTNELTAVRECDLFYADDLSPENIQTLLKNTQKRTLLVTGNDNDLENGFMVSLFLQNNKINFSINHGAILESGLKVNYRLLKVASRVINMKKE